MTRTEVRTALVPRPGSYSQVLRCRRSVFTQGVSGYDPESGIVTATTIEEQPRQAMGNLSDILAAAGPSLDNVVKTTVHPSHVRRDFRCDR
jgi:2-iminobutanoate/2-iminopropanoate deaminase